jgi:hypothetical protein
MAYIFIALYYITYYYLFLYTFYYYYYFNTLYVSLVSFIFVWLNYIITYYIGYFSRLFNLFCSFWVETYLCMILSNFKHFASLLIKLIIIFVLFDIVLNLKFVGLNLRFDDPLHYNKATSVIQCPHTYLFLNLLTNPLLSTSSSRHH